MFSIIGGEYHKNLYKIARIGCDMGEKMKEIRLPFRFKKIKSKYLVTNDYFDWVILSKKDFDSLKDDNLKEGSRLYNLLVDNNFILKQEKVEELSERERIKHNSLYVGPTLHIVVLTKRCPQGCIYCHAQATHTLDKARNDLSMEDAKRYVEMIMNSPASALTIEFQGGEPLMNFDVMKYMIEYALEINNKLKKDLKITCVSNMELMDDEKFNYLTDRGVGLCTSLDGPKSLHDKNRPSTSGVSSYDNTVKWLAKARERNKILGMLMTVTRESLKHPREIVNEYLRQDAKVIHLRPLNYLGNAIYTWKQIGYSAEEFIRFWEDAMDYIIELNRKGTKLIERSCETMLQKILNKKEPFYLDLMSPCGACIGQIAYDYDGKIYSCDEARTLGEDFFQVGDKNSKSVSEIVKSEKALQIMSTAINDSYYCNYCAFKPYCGVCPVCNYRETGSPISDVLRSDRCKILMAQFEYLFEKLQDDEVRKIFESWIK